MADFIRYCLDTHVEQGSAVAASRATGNHYVLVALHLKTVTNLVLRRWRPPGR